MEIQYLREFVTLAGIGNYQEAAEQLYIAQSTLSRHIIAIEKELNIILFNRTRKRVYLTAYGQMFLLFSNQMIEAWEELLKQIRLEREIPQYSLSMTALQFRDIRYLL